MKTALEFVILCSNRCLKIEVTARQKKRCQSSTSLIQVCIKDISVWMTSNRLKLNSEKTKLLLIGSQFRPKPHLPPFDIGGELVRASDSARNIGVVFDSCMKYEAHVTSVCRASFFHIRNLARIRKYLSSDSTKILVHAFITCTSDHCNSLLYGFLTKYFINYN